jgi:hypothetical protein
VLPNLSNGSTIILSNFKLKLLIFLNKIILINSSQLNLNIIHSKVTTTKKKKN